jgi:hypothetical protein
VRHGGQVLDGAAPRPDEWSREETTGEEERGEGDEAELLARAEPLR